MNLGPCEVWDRARTKAGYGQKSVDGKVKYTHRLEWERHNGPIPKGMNVLHRCDNPPCYEIKHLFLGTPKDNARDMASKGRQVFQRNPDKHPRGKKHHNAKVTPEIVRDIRASEESQRVLAKKYELALSTVWAIKTRRTWQHV
jgi:hypothetical protein